MNILFLSELIFPHGGGAEFATYLYAKLLAKLGIMFLLLQIDFVMSQMSLRIGI